MGNLTKNLSRHEIKCPCCGVDSFDKEAAEIVQLTVDHFQELNPDMDVGLHVTSGNRCAEYNRTIPNASPTSTHTEYRALDFYLYDKLTRQVIPPDHVYLFLDRFDKYGVGSYNGRTHFDSRAQKVRWDG